MLVLSSLGFQKIGQSISYGEIAAALEVEKTEVEKWVIDGMSAAVHREHH